MSTAADLRWAELLTELRLLRELVAGQGELLMSILEVQKRIEAEIIRAGL